MKDAFIEHILIFLLVIGSVVVFVATTNDEIQVTNKVSELKRLVDITANNLAKYYSVDKNICNAQQSANEVLQRTNLGKELLDKNLISYIWRGKDSAPSSVTATVEQYREDTFWYKFINLNSFNLNNIQATANLPDILPPVQKQYEYTLKGGGGDALYENIVGTYELDKDGCIIKPRILMLSQKKTSPNSILGKVKIPPEKIFLIADGYKKYGKYNHKTKKNPKLTKDSKITIEGCLTPNKKYPQNYPIVKIDGKGPEWNGAKYDYFFGIPNFISQWRKPFTWHDNKFDDRYKSTHMPAYTFFQDVKFNRANEHSPIQIIAASAWSKYKEFIKNLKKKNQNTNVYKKWERYAKKNNIKYKEDPKGNYRFCFEDGLGKNTDKDYNDTFINSERKYLGEVVIEDNNENNNEIISVNCNSRN